MKTTKFICLIVIASVLIWGIQSCKHESLSDPNAAICFERDILPIFISKCASSGCHDANRRAEGYQLDSYKKIIRDGIFKYKPNSSELYSIITNGEMPPRNSPKLSADEKQLIYDWIALGAKNGINCAVVCDSSNSTFHGAVQPMMNKYCVGCHSAGNASGGVDLSTYTAIKKAINQNLMISLEQNGYFPMPKGGNKLSDCCINQVKKWIANGAQND